MMGGAAGRTAARSRSPRRSARTGGETGRQAAALAGAAVSGWVKSFKGDWGFVNSHSFDGDLFVGLRSNPHLAGLLSSGDQVMFQISVGPGGKAEAINVQSLAAGAVAAAGIGLQENQALGPDASTLAGVGLAGFGQIPGGDLGGAATTGIGFGEPQGAAGVESQAEAADGISGAGEDATGSVVQE